jgi:hypothetical protein
MESPDDMGPGPGKGAVVVSHIDRYLLTRARISIYNHERRGFLIEISDEQLASLMLSAKFCRYCCEPISPGGKEKGTQKQAVDRLNNEMIMKPGNVQIICLRCNSSKGGLEDRSYISKIKSIIKGTGSKKYALHIRALSHRHPYMVTVIENREKDRMRKEWSA